MELGNNRRNMTELGNDRFLVARVYLPLSLVLIIVVFSFYLNRNMRNIFISADLIPPSPSMSRHTAQGLGNLAGEMDFWDVNRKKLMGSTSSHCAVAYGWSPDSRWFLTATCAPRMNVDNDIKV